MAGKYMKVKRVVIPTLTAIIIASQLMGCACSSQKETLKMLNGNEAIEIEIATPINKEEGTQRAIQWQRLDRLTTYEDFRNEFDLALGMESHNGTKVGVAYIDLDGKQQGNNTLYNAFLNEAFVTKYWENEEMQSILGESIKKVYGDVDLDGVEAYAIINAYWNLLPDNDTNYFNAYSTLTRAEAMTLVMRATTPVEENLEEKAEFKEAVGESEYTAYASRVEESSYLQTADESLDEVTFNGTITRAEYLYLLLNTIYGAEEIQSEEIKAEEEKEIVDCVDRGNIAEEKRFKGLEKRVKSNILKESIANVEKGADSELYKAVYIAKKKGIIGEESRWDEGLTKSEAIELFINTMQAYTTEKGYTVNEDKGITMSELYTDQAKKKYNEIKESLVCDEETYVKNYIVYMEKGLTVEETEETLYLEYGKENQKEEEPETQAPVVEQEPETQAPATVYQEPETQASKPVYTEPETQAVYQEPVYQEPETQAPAPVYTEPETQAPSYTEDVQQVPDWAVPSEPEHSITEIDNFPDWGRGQVID